MAWFGLGEAGHDDVVWTNVNGSRPTWGYNLFVLKNLLRDSQPPIVIDDSMRRRGAMLDIHLDFDCNADYDIQT